MSKQIEVDQRVSAWERLVEHPLWKSCFEQDETLIDAMMAKADQLYRSEVSGNEPATDQVPREIKFDEIRKGDLIQVVSVYEQKGIKYYRSSVGTAHVISGGATWYTEEHGHLASYGKGSTIELLDRPKPPLPTTPGTVFRATEIRGEECDVVVMVCDWRALVAYASSSSVAKQTVHNGYDITAWEPIENGDK